METVIWKQIDNGQQAFLIEADGEKLAEMIMEVNGNTMTVYHTEVLPQAEGKGLAKLLLNAMVEYARLQRLTVVPLCVFVHAQFRRHPDLYSDIWQKG